MYSNKINKYIPSNNKYYKCNNNIDVYHLSNKCKLPKNKKRVVSERKKEKKQKNKKNNLIDIK